MASYRQIAAALEVFHTKPSTMWRKYNTWEHTMRALAGAVVVLSGAVLSGAASTATRTDMNAGAAFFGGYFLVAVGLFLVFLGFILDWKRGSD